MDALISLVYTIIDSVCVCLFLDAFASHRWRDHRFLVGVIVPLCCRKIGMLGVFRPTSA